LAEYRDALSEVDALDAGVVGLSVDPPDRSEAMRRSLHLPFPILCDGERRVVRDWGLYNAGEMGGIAFPAVFVVDRDLTIRYRSLDRTRQRVSTGDVLAFLRAGGGGAASPEPRRRTIHPGLAIFALAIRNMLRYGVRAPRA
jgi:peroxiredoxin